ncbi:MAG: hypothetical protein WCR33_06205 [Bacilli bacterium]
MLRPAILYEEKLTTAMNYTWFDEKYKYYIASQCNYEVRLKKDTVDSNQFVSILGDEVLGYIGFSIDRDINSSYLIIINLSDHKSVFGQDVIQAVNDSFMKFRYDKLSFSVIIGNPVEKTYDRLVQQYGGRIVGTHRRDVRLIDGLLYDRKDYELFREDYIKNDKLIKYIEKKKSKAV